MTDAEHAAQHTRMLALIARLEERDPEHGDTHCFDNFLDEYAPPDYEEDEDFDIYEFRDDHAAEYADMLEEYMENHL